MSLPDRVMLDKLIIERRALAFELAVLARGKPQSTFLTLQVLFDNAEQIEIWLLKAIQPKESI